MRQVQYMNGDLLSRELISGTKGCMTDILETICRGDDESIER